MEEWKPIKGYEGLYEVSNMGRVRSLRNSHGNYREHIMKPNKTKRGYLKVGLKDKEGNQKWFLVHRLVLSAFNPIDGMENLQVDHINTIRDDNRVENLRFVTAKENMNNPLTKDKMSGENNPNYGKRGELSPNYGKHRTEEAIEKTSAKLRKKIYCIELDREFNSLSEASELLNINIGNLSSCLKGRANHSYCGRHPVTGEKLHWVYAE